MLKGFRDFIVRGNVIDLAVAVVIGAAFTAVVTSFVNSFVKPLIQLIPAVGVQGGLTVGTDLQGKAIVLAYGDFVNAFISFIATAAVVYFLFVLPMNKFNKRRELAEEKPAEEQDQLSEEILLLREIRDELRANRS